MIEGTRSKDERTLAEFERRVHELSRLRKKPIVVLYYSPYILDGSGGVEPHDAKYLQNHCRA